MHHKRLLGSLTVLALALYGCQAPLAGPSPTAQAPGPVVSQVAGSISGVVRDAQGQLLAGAVVRVLPADAGPRHTPILGATDGSGTFSVKVPGKGPYNVIVQSDRLGQAAVKYRLMNGVTENFDLTPTSSIAGTVTLRDVGPAMGALVYIPGTSFMAVTDMNGQYVITGVPVLQSGGYGLSVSYQGYKTVVGIDGGIEPQVTASATGRDIVLAGLIRPVQVFTQLAEDLSEASRTLTDGTYLPLGSAGVGDRNTFEFGDLDGCLDSYRLLNGDSCDEPHPSDGKLIRVEATGTYLVRYTVNAPPLLEDVESLKNNVDAMQGTLTSHVSEGWQSAHGGVPNPDYRILSAGTPRIELVTFFPGSSNPISTAVPTTFGRYGTTSGKAVITLRANQRLGLRYFGTTPAMLTAEGAAVSLSIERIGEDGAEPG